MPYNSYRSKFVDRNFEARQSSQAEQPGSLHSLAGQTYKSTELFLEAESTVSTSSSAGKSDKSSKSCPPPSEVGQSDSLAGQSDKSAKLRDVANTTNKTHVDVYSIMTSLINVTMNHQDCHGQRERTTAEQCSTRIFTLRPKVCRFDNSS